MFGQAVSDDFKAHAIETFPEEACGLVVEFATGCKYVPCENIAEDPSKDFRIDPKVYVAHVENGNPVRAVIHSHVNGNPGPTAIDIKSQAESALPWGIGLAGEENCQDILWFGDQAPMAPLIGRPFVHGMWDCYSLVRDYYRSKNIVELPNYPRDFEWWFTGENLYLEHFKECGFIEIEQEDLREHDGFLMRFNPSPVPQHAGIYLGDGLMLNHFQPKLSRREPIHGWTRKITHYLRYEGK